MEILTQKREIVDWILALENKDIINDIYTFKNQKTSFNFDEEFAKGLTVEEFRCEMKKRIRNYPLRK